MAVPLFWRRLKNVYNLIGTQCLTCGEYYYPPRNTCPRCRRDGEIQDYKFKGTGRVLTYSIVHNPAKNYQKLTPYILAIIELDEGPRLTSHVICDPEEIKIDMKVKAAFRKLGEESEKGIIYYGTKFVPL